MARPNVSGMVQEVVKEMIWEHVQPTLNVAVDWSLRDQFYMVIVRWRPTEKAEEIVACADVLSKMLKTEKGPEAAAVIARDMCRWYDRYLKDSIRDASLWQDYQARRQNRWYRRIARWIRTRR